ncbi:hypothetical protein CC80DRAFT_511962 [Byssothecium circinans]|uniref:Protein kinase domain-containing protein n=1 Tax=Byssothecium circinans TaxID=147558 RepID=A0A6A5UGH2_9PLEO|nr:hypothetical protein CC80DRAFT_511962 [Byssothecium circinans]
MAQNPMYEIGPTWSSTLNTDVELNVFVSDTHFHIDLFTANFESNAKLLKVYLRHVERPDPDGFDDPLEEFYDWATKPFIPLFRKIPPLDRNRQYTLHDVLSPKEVRYTLHLNGDDLIPVELELKSRRPDGVRLPPERRLDNYPFPFYRQEACFFKQLHFGDISMTARELATYAKIHSAKLPQDARISRLLGVVEDEKTSNIAGFLLSYIETTEHGTLVCAGWNPHQPTLRAKWAAQIAHTIHALHAQDIVWGDAKPENVLVDVHGDAWLIDFGGSFTKGWVDRGLGGAVEGDLQGLERIKEFLAKKTCCAVISWKTCPLGSCFLQDEAAAWLYVTSLIRWIGWGPLG